MKKTFEATQRVEVVPDASDAFPRGLPTKGWVTATYSSPASGMNGWHVVRLLNGSTVYVPSRRIIRATAAP
jgi:hypothetical protein